MINNTLSCSSLLGKVLRNSKRKQEVQQQHNRVQMNGRKPNVLPTLLQQRELWLFSTDLQGKYVLYNYLFSQLSAKEIKYVIKYFIKYKVCVHKQNIVLLLNGQLSFKIALVLTAQQKDFLQSRSKELEITYLYMLYTDFRETQIFHKLTSLLNAFL